MNSSAADLDGDNGVERCDSCLEWFECSILVGEHTKFGGSRRGCQTKSAQVRAQAVKPRNKIMEEQNEASETATYPFAELYGAE